VSRGATVAVAAAGIGLLLLARGLRRRPRPARGERAGVLGPALTVVGATLAYGVLGLVANDHDVRADLGIGGTAAEVGRMALGLGAGVPLAGRFGRLFPASVAAVFWVGVLAVAVRALGPVLVRRPGDPGLVAAVAASDDSLTYFALREDRLTVRAGDALVACGAAAARVWRAAGLVTVHLGDEAVLDLDRFSLEGRAVRIARQSWHRGRRAGYRSLVCRSRDLEPDQVAKLVELSRRWRAGAVERGFSMALGRLLDPRDPGTLVVAASDGDRRLRGFLHLVPWGADGASLDAMRRDRAAPSWLSDFLVVEAARRLPELGVRRLSLNFAFLRAVLAAGAGLDAPWRLRLARWLLRRLSSLFQIESLYRFNRKFAPDWQPRYLALEAPEALPQVALTTLRAEGLLHPPWRLRGRRPGRSASG